MDIESDLRHAALWVDDAAQAAAEPGFAVPYEALRVAAAQLHTSWSGSWLPQLANLYERDLHPLPPGVVLTESGRDAHARVLVDARCRPWTVKEIRAAVSVRAGGYSEVPLQRSAQAASQRFKDAQLCLRAPLEFAARRCPLDSALSHYLRLAQQIVPVDPSSLVDAWRPAYSGRHGIHAGHFDVVPPHIEVLASLEALLSPFDGLRLVAALMRAAADHLEGGLRPLAAPPPVRLAAEARK